ncbi:hypothetical protein BGY98DRAFT_1019241, partial [Russula aff. rugulosa BPL654]
MFEYSTEALSWILCSHPLSVFKAGNNEEAIAPRSAPEEPGRLSWSIFQISPPCLLAFQDSTVCWRLALKFRHRSTSPGST